MGRPVADVVWACLANRRPCVKHGLAANNKCNKFSGGYACRQCTRPCVSQNRDETRRCGACRCRCSCRCNKARCSVDERDSTDCGDEGKIECRLGLNSWTSCVVDWDEYDGSNCGSDAEASTSSSARSIFRSFMEPGDDSSMDRLFSDDQEK